MKLLLFILSVHFLRNTAADCYFEGKDTTYIQNEARDDTERSLFAELTAVNIKGIKKEEIGDTWQFFLTDFPDDVLKIMPSDNFTWYEEVTASNSEPHELILSLLLTCKDESTTTIMFGQPIRDTNNHEPELSSSYTYELPMPFPQGIDLTLLGEDIIAKDIDITNTRIDFKIEPEGDFIIAYDATIDELNKEHRAILKAARPLRLTEEKKYTITATDVGTPTLSTTAELVIKIDENLSMPRSPIFSEPYYIVKYDSSTTPHVIDDPSLLLADGSTAQIELDGEYKDHFTAERGENGAVILKLLSDLSDDVLQENTFFPLTLSARVENAEFVGKTVLIIQLPIQETTTTTNEPCPTTITITTIEPCPTTEEITPCEPCLTTTTPITCEPVTDCTTTTEFDCSQCPTTATPITCEPVTDCTTTTEFDCSQCPTTASSCEPCPSTTTGTPTTCDPECCEDICIPTECSTPTTTTVDVTTCTPECCSEICSTTPTPTDCLPCSTTTVSDCSCGPEECEEFCPTTSTITTPTTETCPPQDCSTTAVTDSSCSPEDCEAICGTTPTASPPTDCETTTGTSCTPADCQDVCSTTQAPCVTNPTTDTCPPQDCTECPTECPVGPSTTPFTCPPPDCSECTTTGTSCTPADCQDVCSTTQAPCVTSPTTCPPQDCTECPTDTSCTPADCHDVCSTTQAPCVTNPDTCPPQDCTGCPTECQGGSSTTPFICPPLDCSECATTTVDPPPSGNIQFEYREYTINAKPLEEFDRVFEATATPTEDILYKLTSSSGSLPAAFIFDEESGSLTCSGLESGLYQFTITATGQTSGHSASAGLIISIQSVEICDDGARTANAVAVTEVQENVETTIYHKGLETGLDDYKYAIESVYPPIDEELFYINDDTGDLHCRKLDREWSGFAGMLYPQFTIRLNLVGNDDYETATYTSSVDMFKRLVFNKYENRDTEYRQCVYIENTIPNLPSVTVLSLIVTDDNDNRPQFAEDKIIVGYPIKDLASLISPAYLLQVEATDADSGANAIVTYSVNSNRVIIHSETGVIYPSDNMFEDDDDDDFDFTVKAVDISKQGSDLEVEVKFLKKDYISVLTLKAMLLEDMESKLQEILSLTTIHIKPLTASVLPTDALSRSLRDTPDTNLVITAYALSAKDELIKTSDLQKSLANVGGLSVSTLPEYTQNPLPSEESSNTGLIAAVSVLAVLLVLAIIAFIAFIYFRKRKANKYSQMEENASSDTKPSFDKNTKMDFGSKPEVNMVQDRRPTGITFTQPVPDETDSDALSTLKIDEDLRERRKSVTFNSNIEQIDIERDGEADKNGSISVRL